MKMQTIVITPLVFVAGILSIVLLQRAGFVSIDTANNAPENKTAQFDAIAKKLALAEEKLSASSNNNVQQNANLVVGSNASAEQEGLVALNVETLNKQLTERIDELQQQIRSSTINADVMQSEINQLGEQIKSASLVNEFLPSGEGANAVTQGATTAAAEQSVQERFNRGWGSGGDSDEQYDSLVAAGVDRLVAEEFKRRNDQWALQRLELLDQATREGWRRSDQFGERMSELRDDRPDLRAELGDDRYDDYLFAAGDFNRVQISNIIDGSAASLAGMQNGDVVVSYANQRMFTMLELQQATSAGSRGEPVQVNVLRDGQLITIEVPRGPLGVSLTGARADPSAY